MTETSLESRRNARRANIAAAAAPKITAPIPATADSAPKASEWAPSDPAFYHRAVVMLAASLKPATLAEDDRQRAEATATAIARALCGGGFPADYITHKNRMVLTHQIQVSEELAAAERPGSKSGLPEGEKAKMRARLEKYAAGAPIPTRAELIKINNDDLADLSFLSDAVRAVALDAIVIGLGKRDDVTGARQDDAFNIAVDAIEHSISVAESLGLPTGEPGPEDVIGPGHFPYPASLAVEFMVAAANDDPDEDEGLDEVKS